ncbi:XRE family transcriptional regulator [Achromobacter xylosoxidans]|uniref:XRE family transcriptional regulator n=1 Tax=Alcaligenes xylosoxydans xylosoxydans TaxID=85698 RepID=UPI0038FC7EF6
MQREQEVSLDFLRIRPSEPMLFIDKAEIARCVTYRQAVRLAWDMRQPRGMTMRTLAELCGMYPQHVSSYLHEDPLLPSGAPRLNLPAEKINAFEAAVGNYAVSQYLNHLGRLTIMQEVIAAQRAA